MDPDGDLVVRIAAGDHAAARALSHGICADLESEPPHARRSGRAEDVAQEVSLRVWTHCGALETGPAKVRNVAASCGDEILLRPAAQENDLQISKLCRSRDPAPGLPRGCFNRSLARPSMRHLSALPERQKEAIVSLPSSGSCQCRAAARNSGERRALNAHSTGRRIL